MTTKKPPSKALTPIDEVRGSLAKLQPQFKAALPKQVSPEKFVRVTMTAVQNNPELLTADRQSLYAACMKAAADGLLPDGREAALVMFGKKATYMPMLGGILKKVRNSGELASIASQVVFKNDTFKYWVDTEGEHLNHEPMMFGDRGERIGVYALAKTKDGAVYIEVLNAKQVDDVRKVSRAKDSGPWAGAFVEEMWKKTAIRRLSKRLPMSTDLEAVIHRDDELYDLNQSDASPEPVATTKASRLSKLIDDEAETAEIIDVQSSVSAAESQDGTANEIPI